MKVVYLQPRTEAARNYRSGDGTEQVWTPWWALLLHRQGKSYTSSAVLIDARTEPDWETKLSQELAVGERAVVAVSAMTGHALRDAVSASRIAKDSGAITCWGGPHPTLFANDVASLPYVDKVIQGFGAPAFADFLRATERGVSPEETAVTDSRGNLGALPVRTQRHTPFPSIPFEPALELVQAWEPYVNADQAIGDRVVNLITSEGCLRRCTYCSEPQTSGHTWLTYDTDDCARIAATLTAQTSASGVKLHDPNFLQDLPRALRFAHAFRNAVGLPWAATIHPADLLNLADWELKQLSDSGLRRVLVGLESSDQALVNKAGKGYQVARIPEIGEKLARHDIAGMFTFICGWPGSDDGHYQRTIDAAFSLKAIDSRHQARIHFLEPWPGTPIYRTMTRSLDLPDLSIEDWSEIDYYFAHLPQLHNAKWESRIRAANEELSPYAEA